MGMIYNHVTIVWAVEEEELEEARNRAIELFDPLIKERVHPIKTDGEFVSQIFTSVSNGQTFFIISTDGSKFGWETNKKFQKVREKFIKDCEDNLIETATVKFGGGDEPKIYHY